MLAVVASKHRDATVRVLRVPPNGRFHRLEFGNALILLDDLASFRNFGCVMCSQQIASRRSLDSAASLGMTEGDDA